MRRACILLAAVAGCSDPLQDGHYAGSVTSSGCISENALSIDIADGKPVLGSSCRAITDSSDEIAYSCSFGGGENHYRCMSQSAVVDGYNTVHANANAAGTKIVGTIQHSDKTLVPPGCIVDSTCDDSGTFILVRKY